MKCRDWLKLQNSGLQGVCFMFVPYALCVPVLFSLTLIPARDEQHFSEGSWNSEASRKEEMRKQ